MGVIKAVTDIMAISLNLECKIYTREREREKKEFETIFRSESKYNERK